MIDTDLKIKSIARINKRNLVKRDQDRRYKTFFMLHSAEHEILNAEKDEKHHGICLF